MEYKRGNNFRAKAGNFVGKNNPMFGKKQSSLCKIKNREMRKGKTLEEIIGKEKASIRREQLYLQVGDKNPFYGRKHTEEAKQKNRKIHFGCKSWNKGLTKETDERVRWGAEKSSETKKEHWKNQEFFERMVSFRSKFPNNKEKQLESILQENFPNEWKYVGDGKFWICRLNPDFININGKKLIIELLGCYWHGCLICYPDITKEDDFNKRKEVFAEYGFNSLAVWEHELRDKSSLMSKVSSFVEKKGAAIY